MKRQMIFFIGLLGVATLAAHGQNGCVDSPENPTAVLGLVGAAGAMVAGRWRRRW